jgi:cell division protein ZapE
MLKDLEEKFKLYCESANLEVNNNQINVIKKLQDYFNENFTSSLLKIFKKKSKKKAFYLHGGVGVGKTMILNFFFDLINQDKKRLHFNEFMLEFHEFVHSRKNKDQENIVSIFAKNLRSKLSLIYFDEFQVTNIVDAMILGKLFEEIFKEDIKIILTSNINISDLYKDGLQRDQFLPFIEIMRENAINHELKIEDDYRKSKENQKQRFFFPLNQETNFKINKFYRIITKEKKNSPRILNIKGRDFIIKNFYEGSSRFYFDELCDNNLGAEDYLEIVKNLKFMIIEKIPQFNDINSNQQQRFITLIDIIYDKNLPIAVTASQDVSKFTSSRSLQEPFKRTVSRLYQLTSMKYNL